MRHDEIPDDLGGLVYDFFFWFRRFEFALKEADILMDDTVGRPAEPGLAKLIATFREAYQICDAGKQLIAANPKRQIVADLGLEFREVRFDLGTSEFVRVIRLAKTVRNALFHGGKHGSAYWNNPERTRQFLATTITVLHDLAEQASFTSDDRSELKSLAHCRPSVSNERTAFIKL